MMTSNSVRVALAALLLPCAALVHGGVAHAQDLRDLGEAGEDDPLFEGNRGRGAVTPVHVPPLGSPEVLADPREPEREASPAGDFEGPIDPDAYACGRGDVLDVNFWGRQNLKQRLVVDSEGRVFLPRVGYLTVAGRTVTEVRNQIRRATRRYYPGVNVDASLAAPRTFLVHVIGNVERPGLYRASPLTRVSTLVERAGALASRRRIEVVRRGGEKVSADLVLYAQQGNVTLNPLVADGDVIRVPFEQVLVSVHGAVRRPGSFELIQSRNLAELMELAGGLRSDASRKLPIRIVRRDGEERSAVIRVAMPPRGQPFPTVALEDMDEVYVESAVTLQPTVLVVGAVARARAPTADEELYAAARGSGEGPMGVKRVPYSDGNTVRSVLELAGGVLPEADLGAAYLDRTTNGKLEHVPLDLEALLVRRDLRADRTLRVGDVVVVPPKRRAVHVAGAVGRPGLVHFNPRFALDEYLIAAGGLTRDARPTSEVKLLRANGQTLPYSSRLAVLPGDTIVVPERNYSRSEIVQITLGTLGVMASIATVIFVATQ